MMSLTELLDNLNLADVGSYEDGVYTLTTNESNTYSRFYSALEASPLTELDPEATVIDVDSANLVYYTDDYKLTLKGDLENNVYKLMIEELV